MKKFNVFKVIQLALLILMTVFSVALLMQPAVKQFVFCFYSSHNSFLCSLDYIISKFYISFDRFFIDCIYQVKLSQSLRCGLFGSFIRNPEPFQL